jgi:hypothetical protein
LKKGSLHLLPFEIAAIIKSYSYLLVENTNALQAERSFIWI